MKGSSFKKVLDDLLTSEVLVYILLVIAVINIIGYLHTNDCMAVLIFIILGFITSKYSKNMIVILALPIILTNLFVSMGYLKSLGQKEGFEENKQEGLRNDNQTGQPGATTTLPRKDDINLVNMSAGKHPPTQLEDTVEELVSGNNSKQPQLKGKGNAKEKSEANSLKKKGELLNENMTHAMNQMKELFGKEGMPTMDQLQKQQEGLMDAMTKIEPMITKASDLIEGLKKSKVGGMLGI